MHSPAASIASSRAETVVPLFGVHMDMDAPPNIMLRLSQDVRNS